MDIDILNFIGEATVYDKKEKIERNKPKSWLKSVSAFANGEGGTLIFGVSDYNEITGLTNAEEVQVIGSKFVLYKESRENKKIP